MARTVLHRIDELAREHPDALVLTMATQPEERLTWRDLSHRAAGVAQLFTARGLTQGDILSIELPNCTGFILAVLAAWRLGVTVSPLRWDLPEPERLQLRALATAKLIVTQTGAGQNEIAVAEIAAAAPLDPAAMPLAPVATPAWMTASGGSTGTPKLIAPKVDTALDGESKGAMPFNSGRSAFADNADHRHPVHLVCTPLYHMHGFAVLFRSLTEDFRVVVMPHFEPAHFLDLVERERVNFIALVPTILIRLLKSPDIAARDLSSLQTVIVGAGATPDWAARRLIELVGAEAVLLGFGMSEHLASSFMRGDAWLERPGTVGQPIGVETLIADEDGEPLPTGEVGEIYFRPLGHSDAFQYVGEARPRTLSGGWASVGDLGRLDADGYLYIVDRRTDMVKTGGMNVFVSEVEAVLLAHADVADAAVIGLADADWGRRVHAVVQPRQGADTTGLDEKLRAHCKQSLAAYKAPRTFEYVASLGRTDAGKLNRQALAQAREHQPAAESA